MTDYLFNYPRKIEVEHVCPNCKQPLKDGEGHFVPPSLGDEGFFTCAKES